MKLINWIKNKYRYYYDLWTIHRNGFVAGGYSVKDYVYEANFDVEDVDSYETVDLRSTSSSVRDQRDTQFCVSFAVGSRVERLLFEVSGQRFRRVSPIYTHYYTRFKHGWPDENKGVSIRWYLDTLFEKGFVYTEVMPFTTPYLRVPEDWQDELGYMSRDLYLKDYFRYIIRPKNVRHALKDGYTVIFGIPLNKTFYGNKTGYVKDVPPNNYYHAMEVEGFIDSEQVYICKNSWNKSRGDNGYFYIPYTYFHDHAIDCWVVRKKS